jgi:RimJ/RimL family protein N-acetyltransferase
MTEPIRPEKTTGLPLGEPVGRAGPASRPRRTRLVGRQVTLRPLEPDADAPELFARSHGSRESLDLWTYMAYGPFPGPDAMRQWLRACGESEDPLFLAVEEAGRRLGMVAFMNVRPEMGVLELGNIWYAPEAQRTLVNTEAVYLILREAFDVLGYRRVEWKCDSLNERSRRAALRLGFRFEGIFRQHMIIKGRNRDTAWFAMLDEAWPQVRSNFERFLAASPGALSLAALNADV